MPQQGLLTVGLAVEKLIDSSKVIHHRMGVKPAENKRVQDAFALLANGPPSVNSKGARQQEIYLDFLQRVQKVLGLSKVVLCAVGLGPSAVANMRDRVRVDLPFEMKEREDEFENDVLQSLADALAAKTFPQIRRNTASDSSRREVADQISDTGLTGDVHDLTPNSDLAVLPEPATGLAGDVYELTPVDVPAVFDEIRGQIWLTDPYDDNTHQPFVTIPISWKLRDQFILQRPKRM